MGQVLPADMPAVITPFDDIKPAGGVASVAIVIACKKISVLIEREFLRIAQASGIKLELRTVWPAAVSALPRGVPPSGAENLCAQR